MTVQRILLAHDYTSAMDPVLDHAVALAAQCDARLDVVNVMGPDAVEEERERMPHDRAFVDVVLGERRDRLRAGLDERLGASAAGLGEVLVVDGDAAEATLEIARVRQTDVLVIGLRNRTRVGKLLFGSTAQEILLHTPCPVHAVPIGV